MNTSDAPATDAADVSRNGTKKLLDLGLSAFFINDKPVFDNGPKGLTRDPADPVTLDS